MMIHQGIHSVPIKFPIELSLSSHIGANEIDDTLLFLNGKVTPAMPNGRFRSIGISRERAAIPHFVAQLVEPQCHQIEAFALEPFGQSCLLWIEYLPKARAQPPISIYVDAVESEGREEPSRSISFDDMEEVYTFHFQVCKGTLDDDCLFECQYQVRFVAPFHLVFLDSGPELWSVDIRKSSPSIQIMSAQLIHEKLDLSPDSVTMSIYNFELDGADVKLATNIRMLIQIHSLPPSLSLLKCKSLIQSNIQVTWVNSSDVHQTIQSWTPQYARDMDSGHSVTAATSAVQIDLEGLPAIGHCGSPITMHFIVRSLMPTSPLYLASLDLSFDEQETHCLVAGLRSRSGTMMDKSGSQSTLAPPPPLSTLDSFSQAVLWPFQPLKIPFVFVPITIGALELPRIQISYYMDRNEKFIISSIKKKLWIAPLPGIGTGTEPFLVSPPSSAVALAAPPHLSLESTATT